jgi:hypothetical protein
MIVSCMTNLVSSGPHQYARCCKPVPPLATRARAEGRKAWLDTTPEGRTTGTKSLPFVGRARKKPPGRGQRARLTRRGPSRASIGIRSNCSRQKRREGGRRSTMSRRVARLRSRLCKRRGWIRESPTGSLDCRGTQRPRRGHNGRWREGPWSMPKRLCRCCRESSWSW